LWWTLAGLVLISGLLSAVWPWLRDQLVDESIRVENEVENVVLELPAIPAEAPVIGGLAENMPAELEFHPLIGAAVLTGAILAPTLITGAHIGLIYTRLDRQTSQVKGGDTFQQAQKELQQREQQKVKELRAGHPPAAPKPKVVGMPRWSVISTSLLILTFTYFLAVMIAHSFFPAEFEAGGRIYSYSNIVAAITTLVVLLILVLYFRSRQPGSLDSPAGDNASVHGGWIWVTLSALIIMGIGLGATFFLGQGGFAELVRGGVWPFLAGVILLIIGVGISISLVTAETGLDDIPWGSIIVVTLGVFGGLALIGYGVAAMLGAAPLPPFLT
jgi:hypothetical protein